MNEQQKKLAQKRQAKLAGALSSLDSRPSPNAAPEPARAEPKKRKSKSKRKKVVSEDREATQRSSTPKARVGKKMIAGYFSPEASKQLKIIAVQHDKSNQELLGEALNLLFAKYKRSEIA